MSFFTKDEIIQRMQEKRAELGDDARADINLALLILGSSLFEKKLKSGDDYGLHPIHVGMKNTRSRKKKIVGFLHDVVEDSEWTVDDLRKIGFEEEIVEAVDAMTHRKGELYFDSIERCSKNPTAVDKKLEDLAHNMDQSRNANFLSEKDVTRIHKYKIAREFLLAVKRGSAEPGSRVKDFVSLSKVFNKEVRATEVANKFSSLKPY